ncbi:ABC transporter ATP-binding protein [Enterococcus faecalis]
MLVSLKRIWDFSKRRQFQLFKAFLFSFIEGLFVMSKMVAVIFAVDVLCSNLSLEEGLKKIIVCMVIYMVGVFFTSRITQLYSIKTGYKMAADKRLYFGNFFKNVYLGYFNESSIGDINSVLTTTISQIEQAAPAIFFKIIGGFLGTISIIIGLLIYEWRIAIIILVGTLAYLVIVNWQISISREEAPKRQDAEMKLTDASIAFFQGIKVIKSYNYEEANSELKDAIENSCKSNLELTKATVPSQISGGLVLRVFESLILITTLYLFLIVGIFTLQKTITLLIFSFIVFSAIGQTGSILSMIGILDSALNEIEKLEEAEQIKIYEPKKHIKSREIIFNNVSFSYEKEEVLKNISTTIKENSLTAIVGPSGSGKSTLCKLIPRFFDVTKGQILIGDVDIRNVETEELMENISFVFQNVYLFEDTILNNIKFAKPTASKQEVIEASKKAGCHDFIIKLENGYNTVVKEGGQSLSGGERQRISIARALLKDAPILILDEITSALDINNEHSILQEIEKIKKSKTVVMIAHRMKTIEIADKIIVLDKGRIVQEGKHKELIRQKGVYQDFVTTFNSKEEWCIR